MAALVAPGVVRYTLSGVIDDSFTWANIWDVDILTDGSPDRATAAAIYADYLIDAWVEHVMSVTSSYVEMFECSWVDLDSLTGSTGTLTTATTAGAAPWGGDAATEPFPANTAVLVTKSSFSTGRGTRPGRLYMVGGNEVQAHGGTLDSGYVTTLNTAWGQFLADVTEPTPEFAAQPVVVHTRNDGTPTNPDIVWSSNSAITGLSVQPVLATQRRRLRR